MFVITRLLAPAAVLLTLTLPSFAESPDPDRRPGDKKEAGKKAEERRKKEPRKSRSSADAQRSESLQRIKDRKVMAEKARAEALKRMEEVKRRVLEIQKAAEASRKEAEKKSSGRSRVAPPSLRTRSGRATSSEQAKRSADVREAIGADIRRAMEQQLAKHQAMMREHQAKIAEMSNALQKETATRNQLEEKLKQQYDYFAKLKAESAEVANKAKAEAERHRQHSQELERMVAKQMEQARVARDHAEKVRKEFAAAHEAAMKRAADNEARAREAVARAQAAAADVRKAQQDALAEANKRGGEKAGKKRRNKAKQSKKAKKQQRKNEGAADIAPQEPKAAGQPAVYQLRVGDAKTGLFHFPKTDDGRPKYGIWIPQTEGNRFMKNSAGDKDAPGKRVEHQENVVRGYRADGQSARIESKSRSVQVDEKNGRINIVVIERQDGEEEVSKYQAANADELRKRYPKASQIYEELKAKGHIPAKPEQKKEVRVRVRRSDEDTSAVPPKAIRVEVDATPRKTSSTARRQNAIVRPEIKINERILKKSNNEPIEVEVEIEAETTEDRRPRVIAKPKVVKDRSIAESTDFQPAQRPTLQSRVQGKAPERRYSSHMIQSRRTGLMQMLRSMSRSYDPETKALMEKWVKELEGLSTK